MKKVITIAAMAMVVGATVGLAQVTNFVTVGPSIVTGPISVNMKVKLTGATKLAAPTVSGVQYATVEEVAGGVTNEADVFGTTILDTLSVVTNSAGGTNTITTTTEVSSNAWVVSDTPVDLGKGKFAEAAGARNHDVAGPFGSSNTEWYVTGSLKESGGKKGGGTTNVSAKVVGIWQEGVSTFSASVSTAKTK
jgi:hypothetical protein